MSPATFGLSVIPEEGVTDRYAEASGDHNPIHLDEAFARSVGLPGRILHGLWTAAQVARAAQSAAPRGPLIPGGAGAPEPSYALASIDIQFRGMGVIGPELAITATVTEDGEGALEVKLDAVQDGTRLVRGARAEVRTH